MSASNTFIQTFTHLKDKPNADKALHMLKRIASLVKPIMREHNWILPTLSEFFPVQDNLLGLNVNMGEHILVRLRPAHSPGSFFDEEDVVGTMLHELTHNVHGPHDDKFYKFLTGLQEEYYKLKRSGYAGEGFFTPGRRLGGGESTSHARDVHVPQHMVRARALEAAERRNRAAGMGLGSSERLGGGRGGDGEGLSPGELAARAAERRARDERLCGSGAAGANGTAQREASKAVKESVANQNFIDLTVDSDDEILFVSSAAGPSRLRPGNVNAKARPKPSAANAKAGTRLPAANDMVVGAESGWTCVVCTLVNGPLTLQCNACLTIRSNPRDAGWVCLVCREAGIHNDLWSCTFCGTPKESGPTGSAGFDDIEITFG